MYGFSLRFIDYTAGRGRGHRVSLNGRILYFRSRSILYFALYNCNIRSRWHISYHSRHSFTRGGTSRITRDTRSLETLSRAAPRTPTGHGARPLKTHAPRTPHTTHHGPHTICIPCTHHAPRFTILYMFSVGSQSACSLVPLQHRANKSGWRRDQRNKSLATHSSLGLGCR